jgi:acetylglutamate kinase
MQEAIRKADALVEAMAYIRAFQGKVFVVKFGGAAMEDPATMKNVIEDVVFLEAVGVKPVLVHGGGPAISRKMKELHIEPTFVHGHRMTDAATLEIVRDVLANEINASICERLDQLDGNAYPMTAPTNLHARRRILEERKPDGSVETYDIGFVGDLDGVNVELFDKVLAERKVPVVAPLASGADGEVLNCNADMVAAQVAVSLKARKAVFLTDIHGIRTDPGDPDTRVSTLNAQEADRMIADGTISGGMLPKVAACRKTLEGGVNKAHIIDGRLPHALLLEIFTDDGVGTQFIH